MDFNESPIIMFIEVTKACLLSCKHCRANAIHKRDPRELTLEDFEKLAKDVSEFNPKPMIIITGGDPLMRHDLFDIIDLFNEHNLNVSISFSGTKLATKDALEQMMGKVKNVAISIDGSNARIHDDFRKVQGTFDTSMGILEYLSGKVSLQINTTVGRHNIQDFPNILDLVKEYKIRTWDLFFIVPTGRATSELSLTKEEVMDTMKFLYYVQTSSDFRIKVTEAPFYNRMKLEGPDNINTPLFNNLVNNSKINFEKKKLPVTRDKNNLGVTDGRGTVFVSHIGDIQPTGFLPLTTGNVKTDSIVEVYRESKLFRDLKDPSKLLGYCGNCAYKEVCGGSRARAYAVYGNYMAEDPACPYGGK